MFTGIITALGRIRTIDPIGEGRDMRLVIDTPRAFLTDPPVALGASIACSGCCLTAVEFGADWFAVDASAETLAHTKLGTWTVGSRVNLERSLHVGDELGGHL
ncbi:MAG TPA: riboflavin synthase, partial [Rhodopila sp.]